MIGIAFDIHVKILVVFHLRCTMKKCDHRDTAKYPPLMQTNKLSNSLKYLAQEYIG